MSKGLMIALIILAVVAVVLAVIIYSAKRIGILHKTTNSTHKD